MPVIEHKGNHQVIILYWNTWFGLDDFDYGFGRTPFLDSYRFYLSFENSLCLDYVTEKLYRPLQYNAVPVVYGGADYSMYLPAGSYVNAMDFNSPERLANYLNKLMKDDELYSTFSSLTAVVFHCRDTMAVRLQHVYFATVTMLAFLLTGITFQYHSDFAIPADWIPNLSIVPNNISRNHSVRSIADSKVNYPWMDDPTCRHFSVQFAKNKSLPKWALTSFPGSGVTWTRQLIEGVTGIYTGTAYGSTEPSIVDGNHHGNEAEHDCGCTIVIKDHGYPETYPFIDTEGPYKNRGILLLRNPFDALFTFSHFLWSGNNQKGTVSPNVFNGTEWDEYISYVAEEWAEHADRWIRNIKHGTVIFYERLLQDTESELRRLLKAINFVDANHPPVDPERMRCTLKHKNRLDRKRSNKPKVPLRLKDHSIIMSSIERVQESLSKKGWPLLPLHLYDLHKPVKALR
ncbi:hypothetical protein GHT06_010139 [Daphnia sinensis]|uniref:Fucosyltransferase n=1 Tax=Daphnia sinensis TaxID=1820382 RepID=A0AAD5LIJ6_9CRUS|nr:hypothetical protein GHT06_010139 [Daphnia sinensis]